jgi:hypothetical protein
VIILKARGFWNDGDGMTADDLEKVMLLVLSCACVITCLISYFLYQDITPNLTNLTLGIVGLLALILAVLAFLP